MNALEKLKPYGEIFLKGVNAMFTQEWVWGMAVVIGLYQGLKYKGSIRSGLAGGLATLAVISGANGLYNVAKFREGIKEKI